MPRPPPPHSRLLPAVDWRVFLPHCVVLQPPPPPPPPPLPRIESYSSGMKILLKQEGNDLPIATMEVGEIFTPDKPLETLKCYGTSQLEHPGEFREGTGTCNLLHVR